MKHLFVLLTCFSTAVCFGQISYKKGFFVDKQGNKTECYIQDAGWNYSPGSINYRLTEEGETQKVDTENISEFSFPGVKYVRAKVQYDQSLQDLKNVGVTSNPDWAQGDLLLKVVVDGKGKLYHYSVKVYSLFFFSVDGGPIEQLVFKNYLKPGDHTQMLTNRMYLAQLNTRVKCGDKGPVNERQVAYQLRPLANHFKEFNICSGETPVEDLSPTVKAFSLSITPGVNFIAIQGRSIAGGRAWDWGQKTTFRTGVDLQFALPFQKGKWAIVAEPNFYTFKGETNGSSLNAKVVELPIGIRHRFFLSDQAFIFVNAYGLLEFPLSHKQVYMIGGFAYENTLKKGYYGYALGAGFAWKRLSVEARYYPEHERKNQDTSVFYTYNRTTVILGFRIF